MGFPGTIEATFEVLDTHAETHVKDGRIELKDCIGRRGV